MWRSKAPGPRASPGTNYVLRPGTQCTGTAHYVEDDAPLCAALRLPDGRARFAPFLCTWTTLRSFDKPCGHCRRALHDRELAGRGRTDPRWCAWTDAPCPPECPVPSIDNFGGAYPGCARARLRNLDPERKDP